MRGFGLGFRVQGLGGLKVLLGKVVRFLWLFLRDMEGYFGNRLFD